MQLPKTKALEAYVCMLLRLSKTTAVDDVTVPAGACDIRYVALSEDFHFRCFRAMKLAFCLLNLLTTASLLITLSDRQMSF